MPRLRPVAPVAEVIEKDFAMSDSDTDMALLQQAVRHMLEQGVHIDLIGDGPDPQIEVDGQLLIPSQVILRAYALGMAEADHHP